MKNLSFITDKIITAIETFDVTSEESRKEYNNLIGCLFRIVIAERKINRSTLFLSKSIPFTRVPHSIKYMNLLFGKLFTLSIKELIVIFECLTLQKSLYEVVFDRNVYDSNFSMIHENIWFRWQYKGENLSTLYKELL